MAYELPTGYWFKDSNEISEPNLLRIGFQFGGHMGGECEILLPTNKFDKFCKNTERRKETIKNYSKIVFLAQKELNVEISANELKKSGIVPDEWE